MKSLAYYVALLSTFFYLVSAQVRTSPPAGCLAVQKGSKYSTVQSAIDAVNGNKAACIFIYPGIYTEQVYIDKTKPPLTIYGFTVNSTQYGQNSVVILASRSQDEGISLDESATLSAWSQNLKVYNINVINGYGKGAQAVALSAQAAKQGYYSCSFDSYQDSVYLEKGTQIISRSKITGAENFIIGRTGRTWLDNNQYEIIGKGWVTAQGRDSGGDGWFVLNGGSIKGAGVANQTVYLGRPWTQYARVTVQKVDLGPVVRPEGWSVWNKGDERTSKVEYTEYQNTGEGAKGTRPSWAKVARSLTTITTVLGNDYRNWVDTTFL